MESAARSRRQPDTADRGQRRKLGFLQLPSLRRPRPGSRPVKPGFHGGQPAKLPESRALSADVLGDHGGLAQRSHSIGAGLPSRHEPPGPLGHLRAHPLSAPRQSQISGSHRRASRHIRAGFSRHARHDVRRPDDIHFCPLRPVSALQGNGGRGKNLPGHGPGGVFSRLGGGLQAHPCHLRTQRRRRHSRSIGRPAEDTEGSRLFRSFRIFGMAGCRRLVCLEALPRVRQPVFPVVQQYFPFPGFSRRSLDRRPLSAERRSRRSGADVPHGGVSQPGLRRVPAAGPAPGPDRNFFRHRTCKGRLGEICRQWKWK